MHQQVIAAVQQLEHRTAADFAAWPEHRLAVLAVGARTETRGAAL